MPAIMGHPYAYEFLLTPGKVTIVSEAYTQVRHIYTDGFSLDFARTNGIVKHTRVLAGGPGRVIYVEESHDNGAENAISVYHAATERAVYMHIQKGFFSKYFPGVPGLPQDLPVASQPTFAAGDPLCDIGEWTEPEEKGNEHLHFSISAISRQTWGADGVNGAARPGPH
jgi:hypothetical protein